MSDSGEVEQALRAAVRNAVATATEVGVVLAQTIAARARQVQHDAEAQAQVLQQRLRAEYVATRPLLRQPWNAAWWKKASPEQIGQAWQAATSWAEAGDPYAHQTRELIRREVADRYGVRVARPDLPGQDLAGHLREALGPEADVGQLRERARVARAKAAAMRAEAGRSAARAPVEGAVSVAADEAVWVAVDSRAEEGRAEAAGYLAQAVQDERIAQAWEALSQPGAWEAVACAAEAFPGTPAARLAAGRTPAVTPDAAQDVDLVLGVPAEVEQAVALRTAASAPAASPQVGD